ncbi:RCC1 domain-containing protein 1-like isoform X2 [Salvia hispanica]|uniref:RCC1 domain-containing protein 1-like isoform X2 n=1 Tax=Salvia hispanica TaxID=49212 RepID=UPI002009A3B3|nr:RCC1 domain-containing protein 1-like isoform X2 [Salvia hispanica]
MNGDERKEDGSNDESEQQLEVLMCGYFPGVTAQRSPLNSPASVRFPEAEASGDSWKDICAGGCGFGMAISASGKLVTWGSSDDQGQSYFASGKHGETPEVYPLPSPNPITEAAASWAHCVSVTDKGEVYTWGWKECVPSVKITCTWNTLKTSEDQTGERQSSTITDQVLGSNDKLSGDEMLKRRKVVPQQDSEALTPADETLSMPPCPVSLDPGVRITSVAAGGRHTLALSDVGQVWGWGYGGEGQLGLGSRIKMVASPHLIPCIDPSLNGGGSSGVNNQNSDDSAAERKKSIGNYVKGIACGGRHSAVITDTGVLFAFGWGLYGQCGQGNTEDILRPTFVPFLRDSQIKAVAAGLWHTICISSDGRVYVFGGNQFGQLGLGTHQDQCEVVPRLLDASVLESKKAKIASSGARHNAILTARPRRCGRQKHPRGSNAQGRSQDEECCMRLVAHTVAL